MAEHEWKSNQKTFSYRNAKYLNGGKDSLKRQLAEKGRFQATKKTHCFPLPEAGRVFRREKATDSS
jgi:hypothetical protein